MVPSAESDSGAREGLKDRGATFGFGQLAKTSSRIPLRYGVVFAIPGLHSPSVVSQPSVARDAQRRVQSVELEVLVRHVSQDERTQPDLAGQRKNDVDSLAKDEPMERTLV